MFDYESVVPARKYNAQSRRSRRVGPMFAACVLLFGLSACGGGEDLAYMDSLPQDEANVALSREPGVRGANPVKTAGEPGSTPEAALTDVVAATPEVKPAAAPSTAVATAPASPAETVASPVSSSVDNWLEVAIRDMRAPDGAYAKNDDRLLHRNASYYSAQSDRAVLVMGKYGTSAAFTTQNPDYKSQLSWMSSSDPMRYIDVWPRLNLWDQVYLGETYGANHAPGYTGNARVRTWGYEMWVKSKSGAWRQLVGTDGKSGEAWRPTFQGAASFESYAFDLRKETDGSTSVRTMPAIGFDSTGTYWVPHGYTGGVQAVDPYDVEAVFVLVRSQLILHDPRGIDDRHAARFLLGVGADWYPPSGVKLPYYPGVGTSRHKFVTVAPQVHVMHTMTEQELRANPPPLR